MFIKETKQCQATVHIRKKLWFTFPLISDIHKTPERNTKSRHNVKSLLSNEWLSIHRIFKESEYLHHINQGLNNLFPFFYFVNQNFHWIPWLFIWYLKNSSILPYFLCSPIAVQNFWVPDPLLLNEPRW